MELFSDPYRSAHVSQERDQKRVPFCASGSQNLESGNESRDEPMKRIIRKPLKYKDYV